MNYTSSLDQEGWSKPSTQDRDAILHNWLTDENGKWTLEEGTLIKIHMSFECVPMEARRLLYLLKLRLQTSLSCPKWMSETKSRYPGRAANVLYPLIHLSSPKNKFLKAAVSFTVTVKEQYIGWALRGATGIQTGFVLSPPDKLYTSGGLVKVDTELNAITFKYIYSTLKSDYHLKTYPSNSLALSNTELWKALWKRSWAKDICPLVSWPEMLAYLLEGSEEAKRFSIWHIKRRPREVQKNGKAVLRDWWAS